ncbi:TPA: hypothetical protein M4K80_004103 [Salmonella enterica]|nr:hypothetical protein [Salmonella enterica]
MATTKKIAGLYRFSSLAQHSVWLTWINQKRCYLENEYKSLALKVAIIAINVLIL